MGTECFAHFRLSRISHTPRALLRAKNCRLYAFYLNNDFGDNTETRVTQRNLPMLKKTIVALLCCAANSSFAAPLIDLKLAVGVWDSSPSGDIGESVTDVDTLDLDSDQATFFSPC